MNDNTPQTPRRHSATSPPPVQSIPLRELPRPGDADTIRGPAAPASSEGSGAPQGAWHRRTGTGAHNGGREASSPIVMSANLPGFSSYWEHPYPHADDPGDGGASPIDPMALQFALPPDIHPQQQHAFQPGQYMTSPPDNPYQVPHAYYEERADTDSLESDMVPLKPAAQPIGRLEPHEGDPSPRNSFQTVSDLGNTPSRARSAQMLGFDLEPGLASDRHRSSYGDHLSPMDQRSSRSLSTSGALSRAGTIMRAMSQRVVMISGEGDLVDQQTRRNRSRSPSADGRRPPDAPGPMLVDASYPSHMFQPPAEKRPDSDYFQPVPPVARLRRQGPLPNPLKGKSLGIFPPENPIRKRLCDLLVNPWMEPFILVLIIAQAILLAIEAAPDVFVDGNSRPDRWGSTRIDWAIFALFVIFTLEIIARVIVSGLVINADEYAPVGSKRRLRERVAEQYRHIFKPQRQRSVRQPPQEQQFVPTFARSFTMMQGVAAQVSLEEQQRLHLARRAFLRHGFNRLDFVAVVAFWISFILGVTGVENKHSVYVFRMLSSLRIIRLLALTKGNIIILRSLKKSAPLLVRVSFLMGFFWLLFAIVGVQSFKTSLSRQCTWINPEDPTNFDAAYTPDMSFCGGHLNALTGEAEPWVYSPTKNLSSEFLLPGASNAKGFLCPRGSICLQQDNPFNGTVHFDDIGHSLELVFVIMSANTFTDLMYYTISSDFLPAALFFGAGIIIMMLWMTNLLIAVITSSFQVIREESKASAFTADDEQPLFHPDMEKGPRRQSAFQRIHRKTSWLWVVLILFGLFSQALRSATMSSRREEFINAVEIVVTSLLDVEIVLRLIADFRRFHRKPRNLFDLGLAIITTVILFPPIRNSGQVYNWLTIFQIIRAYRVVLAIPMTSKLIQLVLGNVTGIGNLMLFVFLITFLMAIFASQLFRGQLPPVDDDDEPIRIPFNTIYNSFLGMYQVLSSEGWTEILYNITSYTTHLGTAWIGAVFIIGWFILSYFILINMFIAVIQENFDVSEDVKRLEQVKAFLQRRELGTSSNLALSRVFGFGRSKNRVDPVDQTTGVGVVDVLFKETFVREFLDEALDELQEHPKNGQSPQQPGGANGRVKTGLLSALREKATSLFRSREPNPFYSNVRFGGPIVSLDPAQLARQAVSATQARRKAQREYLMRHPNYNTSLFLFKPRNRLRRLCQQLVGPGRGTERFDGVQPNKYAWYTFSAVIYIAIVAMVVLACVSTPLYQKEYFETHPFSILNWFVWTDTAFAIVFSVEALIKIIADGFFWTPNAYFRSTWGIIDAIVLITLWINVVTLFLNAGEVSRAVGAFKALRALRLLNVSDSARETFHSLMIVGGWKILSAAFVSISLLIPFAIYGVNLFNGKLMACNDGEGIVSLSDCVGEYNSTPFNNDWPMLAPRVASNPFFNFDDFGSSLFILFQIVSQEGWTDVSFAAQAITGKGLQPEGGPPFTAQGNALFFVAFNLLATVFVLTLFISVFMRNYTEQTGVAFLTAEQRSWLELRKLLRQISPSKSAYDDKKNKWKLWCHKRAIEKRGKWYLAITTVLVFHLLLLLTEFSDEPEWLTQTKNGFFLVFILIYTANIIVRVVGLGWTRFRKSSWDLFSLAAVAGAFATSILFLTNRKQVTYIQLHKFFLVALVLLLIPRNDALDQLFKTAAASLTTIGSLLATWLVFFLVFAIALTQTFSLTRFGGDEDANINLRTVPHALILLFRFSCGEGWNEVMEDFAQIKSPFCVEGETFFDSDCGSTAWARVLFVAWNIISMYIFVSLFVSLIYESFSYVYQRTSGLAAVDRDEIRRFKEAWRSVDPSGTGFISKEAFPRLLGELSGVFEMRIYDNDDSVRAILDDVRNDGNGNGNDAASIRHASIISKSQYQTGIDLKKLNERLSRIDVAKVRERRRRFNIFFEEVMVSADPERGISFTTVLMLLAHYNIINDSKALRLEEFLRRKLRLQRVEEEVRRRIVLGFFDMLYYSRQFKRHMDTKRAGRMTAIPQLDIPEILVDNEDGNYSVSEEEEEEEQQHEAQQTWQRQRHRQEDGHQRAAGRSRAHSSGATTGGAAGGGDGGGGLGSSSGGNNLLSPSSGRAKSSQHRSWAGLGDLSSYDTSYSSHPLAAPRASRLSASAAVSPGGYHRSQASAFSFEVTEPGSSSGVIAGGGGGGDDGEDEATSLGRERGSSRVDPAVVRDMLDDSVWVESLRRSATTMRRSGWGSGGFR